MRAEWFDGREKPVHMQLDYKKLNDIKNQGRADCTPLKFNNPGLSEYVPGTSTNSIGAGPAVCQTKVALRRSTVTPG